MKTSMSIIEGALITQTQVTSSKTSTIKMPQPPLHWSVTKNKTG